MRIPHAPRRTCSGQIMAEACIGLSLMTLVWIVATYSLFMANNHLRTAMAARHAAWFRGAGSTEATAAQLDDWFFFQPGLSKVQYTQGKGIADVLAGASQDAQNVSADENGPWLATVTFGVDDLNSATQFPFDLLKTHVPFMPDSTLRDAGGQTVGLSVKSSCQWEEVSDTWTTPGKAVSGIFDSLKSIVTDTVKKLL